jgi:hypothetical protein
VGSQSGKHRGRGGHGGGSGGGGGGGGDGGVGSSSLEKKLDELLHDKKFKEAAQIGIGTANKITGTDLLVDAAFAGVKGYQEAKKHGVERGARVAATNFAKSQSIGSASDVIATVAVRSVPGLNAHPIARDIVRDAVSSSIDQVFEGRLGG